MKVLGEWPDFVFSEKYKLRPLSAIRKYTEKYGHLPEVPSAAEVKEHGQDLGKMNQLLMKKVEELTLYLLQKDEQLKMQDKRIIRLEVLVCYNKH